MATAVKDAIPIIALYDKVNELEKLGSTKIHAWTLYDPPKWKQNLNLIL